MGRHKKADHRVPRRNTGTGVARAPWSLQLVAIFASTALVFVGVVTPNGGTSEAFALAPGVSPSGGVQALSVAGDYANTVQRDAFTVTEAPVAPVVPVAPAVPAASESSARSSVPAAGTPDPGTAQAVALEMLTSMGWGNDQFSCLVALWNRESGWNVYAHNASSGAYGIPQALPGSKMAAAGADWATNPATQIAWGLSYISSRYGTPCGAWGHSETVGWY